MTRERCEDLGRLAVLLEHLLEDEFFEVYGHTGRRKDFPEWFALQPEDKREEIIRMLPYDIEKLRTALYTMIDIAQGIDPLNLATDEK